MKKILRRLRKSKFENHFIWLERIFKNGWHHLMRNKLLTAGTTLIIALMFFVFNLVLALSFASDSVLLSVGKKIDIRTEILPETENYTVQTLVNELKALPGVAEVIFTDKEKALNQFGQKYPNVITFLENNQLENPLPGTLRIITHDVSANKGVILFLEQPKFSRVIDQGKLKNDTEQRDRHQKILNITQFIKRIGLWLNLTFAIVCLLIIFNSININIHTHQQEINIMRLVGATPHFIRGGYLISGIIYGVLALILSIVFARLTLLYLSHHLIQIIQNENLLVGIDAILLHFDDHFWTTFIWQLLGAVSAGLISSYLAIELYLKKRFSF